MLNDAGRPGESEVPALFLRSQPISSLGYYLHFMQYITKTVLMIYHLYYGIVSIIYSDHAEIPGKLSKRNSIESKDIYFLAFLSLPLSLLLPPHLSLFLSLSLLMRIYVKKNHGSLSY